MEDGAFFGCANLGRVRFAGSFDQWDHIGVDVNNDAILRRGDFLPGDVNIDGKINSTDARLLLRAAAKIIPETKLLRALGDLNADGRINSADARADLQISARLLPAPQTTVNLPLLYD